MRNLVVDGQNFLWRVGKSQVLIRDSNNKGYYPMKEDVGKLRPFQDPECKEIECSCECDPVMKLAITPADVVEYIRKNIMGVTV